MLSMASWWVGATFRSTFRDRTRSRWSLSGWNFSYITLTFSTGGMMNTRGEGAGDGACAPSAKPVVVIQKMPKRVKRSGMARGTMEHYKRAKQYFATGKILPAAERVFRGCPSPASRELRGAPGTL